MADLRLFDIDIVVLKEPETYVGGIASGLEGTLRNDRVTGRIVAIHAFAGGLVGGTNGNPTIVHSSADVDVQAGIAGGLLGFGGSTVIAYSYATGSVEASKVKGRRIPHTAGGLVGVGYGTIDQSFATGRVTGGASATIGGLVGIAEMTITNSYALGDLRVVAGTQAGGLIGLSFQQASTSYAANGVLSGATDAFGGFVSSTGARAVFSDDYWDSVYQWHARWHSRWQSAWGYRAYHRATHRSPARWVRSGDLGPVANHQSRLPVPPRQPAALKGRTLCNANQPVIVRCRF